MNVAVYCRVSTEKSDQANSFAGQQRFFREYISRTPDWRLFEVYADEGISGTSVKNRHAFQRMLCDARAGSFRLILTKEVSRFSRNIVDAIQYTRDLKAMGVGVLFVNDGINTLDPDAELRLSIMSTMAQEESRKTSERVKWGQSRQMERGVVFGRSLLGYDVANGALTVNPQGAQIVRVIFQKYAVEGKGITTIARELREAGDSTAQWSSSRILKILKNEKYVGDLVQKKTYTPNYLTHKKKYNHGEQDLIIIENHHEPIISRELWDAAQALLKQKNVHNQLSAGHSNRYVFSGRIQCGECGSSFVSRKKYRKDGSFYKKWGCGKAASQHGCDIGRMLRDDAAMAMLRQAICGLQFACVADRLTTIVLSAIQAEQAGESREKILERIEALHRKRDRVLDDYYSDAITYEEMRRMTARYDGELGPLKKKLAAFAPKKESTDDLRSEIHTKIKEILCCQTASEAFYRNLLGKITVHKDGRLELKLQSLPQTWIFT